MAQAMITSARLGPSDRSAIAWQTRLASFKSRGLPDTDPRVVECKSALAYWRIRKVVSDARGTIAADHIDLLIAQLRMAVSA